MSEVRNTPGRLRRLFTVKRLVVTFCAVALLLTAGAYGVQHYSGDVAKPMNLVELEAATILSDPRLHAKLIRTAESDYRYNCHGWTFTHGQREVEADEVERLLAEEYEPACELQLDDIIVYRDHCGQVMHSGVVKAVGQNGFVLVESKWGTSGRFIHEPNIERTFASFDFFHKVPALAKEKDGKKTETETMDAVGDDE